MSSASVPPTAEPVRALLELAVKALQAGRPAAAITPLRQAALLRPQAAMIHHDLGLACLETGLVQESVDAFRRAVACDPRSTDAHFRLAIGLERLGDLGAALVSYHRATELEPSLTEAWYRAGALVHTLGHRDEAIACFERAAQSGSKTRFGRLGAARALLTAGRDREGERALRACVAADPENPLAHDLLGNLLAESGHFEEAGACFTRAMPSQSYFYTSTPAAGNQANPETATASQIGIVRLADRYGIALDVYNVNFDNYVTTFAVPNGDTVYENSGTVRYRGIEAEAHLTLGLGFTAVGNASLIRAIFLDSGMTSTLQRAGDTIPYAPNYLALAGVTYQNGPWGGSLLTKFLGTEYQGKNGSADGSTYRVNEYSYTNATATRTFDELLVLKRLRLTAAVNNLFDSDATTDNSGPSSQGPNLINVLAKRNYSLSFAADF